MWTDRFLMVHPVKVAKPISLSFLIYFVFWSVFLRLCPKRPTLNIAKSKMKCSYLWYKMRIISYHGGVLTRWAMAFQITWLYIELHCADSSVLWFTSIKRQLIMPQLWTSANIRFPWRCVIEEWAGARSVFECGPALKAAHLKAPSCGEVLLGVCQRSSSPRPIRCHQAAGGLSVPLRKTVCRHINIKRPLRPPAFLWGGNISHISRPIKYLRGGLLLSLF